MNRRQFLKNALVTVAGLTLATNPILAKITEENNSKLNKKMKAIFINGSPRKNKNTAQMLQSAMKGAQQQGAQTELIHLYDIPFTGCKSCFACKLKNATTNGICAIKDDLKPVLERCYQADILVFGSPVYYSYPTGMMRAFMERAMFPIGTYLYENGKHILTRKKIIPSAMIFTMNCPENMATQINYPILLETANTKIMEDIYGYAETLYAYNTYQFNDYSRYDFNLFSEEEKRKYRDEHWEKDLHNAFLLGERLTQKAIQINQ